MKPRKDLLSYMDDIKEAQAEGVANIDLDGINLPAQLYRDMEALRKDGEKEAAEELHVTSVMDAVMATDEKEFLAECARDNNRKGGKKRGKQKIEEANKIKTWLYPLLAECEAEFPPERKNRGFATMMKRAIKKVTKDDPRKKYLTRARIQTWINEGKPKIWPT